MPKTSYLLISAALVAIAAGAWPTATRLYAEHQRETQARSREAALAQEIAKQKSDIAANKPAMINELTALQQSGQHAEVMRFAARYRLANDPDIHAIFVRSAEYVSSQQLIGRMEQLVAKSCNGIQAIQTASASLSSLFPEVKTASSDGWLTERLDATALLPQIRARIKEWQRPPDASTKQSVDALAVLRREHSPRLLPQVQQSLLTATDASALLCAWRVEGAWPVSAAPDAVKKKFQMVVWYAPSATERTLEHDVLSLKI
jgi:hypothetical protein